MAVECTLESDVYRVGIVCEREEVLEWMMGGRERFVAVEKKVVIEGVDRRRQFLHKLWG